MIDQNYLRKALYSKYYPVVHEMRDNIPDYWMHVGEYHSKPDLVNFLMRNLDHCIETLRETVQCNMDLTPVPHIWSKEKGMYLADTQLVHTCRNFDRLAEWQDSKQMTLENIE